MVYLGLAAVAAALLVYGYCLNFFPVREEYVLTVSGLQRDVRFLLLSDLHACDTGRGNQKLLRMIRAEEPDFICIAGDMTVKNGKHTHRVLTFLRELAVRYPVYYSPGNHEIRMPDYERYKAALKEMGVVYLENERASAAPGIAVVGLDLPEYWYHKCWQRRDLPEETLAEWLGNPPDSFTILLAHNPEYFPRYADWGADLTLSGHIHGGIARLPVLGGVLSPSLRLFPKYDAGLFSRGEKRMIVSRGLGLHHIKFRFFNRPELSSVLCRRGKGDENYGNTGEITGF